MFALQTFLFGLVFFVPWTLSSHFNRTIMRNGFLARANVPTRNLIAPLENDGTFVALQDKLNSEFDQRFEGGANMWHQSMNKSFLDRHNSVLNVAHSEPLRHGTVKDANLNDKDDRTKPPPCSNRSNNFRHYCSYKEDYPTEMVAKLIKYYKYPLESMFKELRVQVMPPLAKDDKGEMVCSSVTQLIRVGWAMDTNGRWFVVLNQDHYHQYITEVICRHGNGSNCNFVAPCFRAKCLQRFNTQKLLVIDPYDPYKGPFMSEFLFPSCCVCHLETSK